MMKIKTLAACAACLAVLTGCGKAHFQQRVVNTPTMHSFSQCSETRHGDTNCVEEVNSSSNYYGGGFTGLGLGSQPAIYMANVPVVTDGEQALRMIPGGTSVIVPVATRGVESREDANQNRAIKDMSKMLNRHDDRINKNDAE